MLGSTPAKAAANIQLQAKPTVYCLSEEEEKPKKQTSPNFISSVAFDLWQHWSSLEWIAWLRNFSSQDLLVLSYLLRIKTPNCMTNNLRLWYCKTLCKKKWKPENSSWRKFCSDIWCLCLFYYKKGWLHSENDNGGDIDAILLYCP